MNTSQGDSLKKKSVLGCSQHLSMLSSQWKIGLIKIRSMMESSDESPGSEDEPCECVHDVNESLPPDADTEPEEGTDKHTNLHSEIPSIIEEALVPPLTRKMSPGLMYHNEYFEVAKSSVAGWGAFAVRDLAKGDVILREIPLFVAETDNVFHEFYKLDKDAMDVALSLHSHGLIKGGTPKIIGIWQTNCFAVTHHMAGLFPIAARFNHACYPANNVDYQYDHDNNALTMMAREDIAAGKELTISYGMNLSPLLLYLCYGFRCSCGGCKGLNDEEVAIFTMQW
ncbi:set domain-containing [Trichoderma arundinaceum]|uniref:Set domain-containing n=1 Tax=Trichoderma arundinaceum TaxID=490622 RepID=A0A395NPE7_TRIAR|nr:set domain-containing [Trichoderma arundinaceum]